jgi:hypothetical protein
MPAAAASAAVKKKLKTTVGWLKNTADKILEFGILV